MAVKLNMVDVEPASKAPFSLLLYEVTSDMLELGELNILRAVLQSDKVIFHMRDVPDAER